MQGWSLKLFEDMAEYACRAPSVHNVQPWKIQFAENGFKIFQVYHRRLFVGDPNLHDNDVSLGCFIELCSIFLEGYGFSFRIIEDSSLKIQKDNEKLELRFFLEVYSTDRKIDPLFDLVFKRKSYRGVFDSVVDFNESSLISLTTPGLKLKWIIGKKEMKEWAKLYDEASSKINQRPGYFKELLDWLRFDDTDPRFLEDGLNYKALALNKLEAILGKKIFTEFIFKFLASISLEKILISEAPQIKSSLGIIIVYANSDLKPLEMGRAFVRFWLKLTELNLYACPLSALVDFTGTRDILNLHKPEDATIPLNVLRFGKVTNESKIYSSPRISSKHFIL